jgi:hypothetical protein
MGSRGIRAEDLLLAAWNAVGVPLIGAGALAPLLGLGEGDRPDPIAGFLQLVAVLGAIVAIATRPSGSTVRTAPFGTDARVAFIGPLVGAMAFVAGSAAAHLGLAIDGPVIGIAFIVTVAAMILGDRLPVVDAGLRRVLLLPFILVCAGIFDGFAADLLTGLDVGELFASLRVDETGFGLFLVGMIVAGLAAFYASLVVAPRLLIGVEEAGGCLVWPMRFVLFLVSALLGIGWLSAISP